MPTQWESLANEHILGIAPYEPGKPIEELEREFGIPRAMTAMTKLVFLANPNNPTGPIRTADGGEPLMAGVPGRTIGLFGEGYIEVALGPDFPEGPQYGKPGPKGILPRTFSKAASLA